jgi:hypothetical protein
LAKARIEFIGICQTPPVFKALPNPLRSKAVFSSYLMPGSEASPATKKAVRHELQ